MLKECVLENMKSDNKRVLYRLHMAGGYTKQKLWEVIQIIETPQQTQLKDKKEIENEVKPYLKMTL